MLLDRVHLEMAKVVTCMFYMFYHNQKFKERRGGREGEGRERETETETEIEKETENKRDGGCGGERRGGGQASSTSCLTFYMTACF